LFRRVQTRLTLLSVAIFLVIFAILSVSIFGIVTRTVLQTVNTRIALTMREVSTTGPSRAIADLPDGQFVVVRVQNKTYGRFPIRNKKVLNLLEKRERNKSWTFTYRTPTGPLYRVAYNPALATHQGTAQVLIISNIRREWAVLYHLRNVLLIVGSGGLLLAVCGGYFLAERALRPIRAAWQRQIEFVADASHELRTPLAVIRSNLDIVLSHSNQSILENLEWVNNAQGESRRLAKLVEDLLTLARSDSNERLIEVIPVDLSALLRRTLELFDVILLAKELTLETAITPTIQVSGDESRLQQLVVIFLDNACKYTATGGTIHVRLYVQKNIVILEIADTGIGMTQEECDKVFDRFFRADAARAFGNENGAGLGLSIAKWIVDVHQGKINVTSQVGQGTTFHITLPLH